MKKILFALLFPTAALAQVNINMAPNTTLHLTIPAGQNDPSQDDSHSGKCGMSASIVKSIGLNKQSGMSKAQQLKIFGDTSYTRFWINRVYVAPKDMTPQDMHDVVYEQCMEGN